MKNTYGIIFFAVLFCICHSDTFSQIQFGVHWGNAVSGTPPVAITKALNNLQPYKNINIIRTLFSWKKLDTLQGASYDWATIPQNVDTLISRGFQIIGTLRATPSWYTTNPNPNNPSLDEYYAPQDTIEWIRYVDSVVTKFKGKVKYWEIYNEPDGVSFLSADPNKKGREYFEVLESAYNKIKSIDTSCKVLLGGLTSRVMVDRKSFVDTLFKLQAYKYFDIMNVHIYEQAASFKIILLPMMQTAGIESVPIWVTETNPWRILADSSIGNSIINTSNYLRDWLKDSVINCVSPKVILWFNLRNWVTSGQTGVCDNCDPNKTAYGLLDSLYNPTLILSSYSNYISTVTSIKNLQSFLPVKFRLFQNYPNPFNPATTINYSIPKASFVTIKVYDVLGKEVAALVNEEKPRGNYKLEFDAGKLSSGIYFYRMQAGGFVETQKLLLLK